MVGINVNRTISIRIPAWRHPGQGLGRDVRPLQRHYHLQRGFHPGDSTRSRRRSWAV